MSVKDLSPEKYKAKLKMWKAKAEAQKRKPLTKPKGKATVEDLKKELEALRKEAAGLRKQGKPRTAQLNRGREIYEELGWKDKPDRRHVPRTSAASKPPIAAAETEKLYEQSRAVMHGATEKGKARIKDLQKAIDAETNRLNKIRGKEIKPPDSRGRFSPRPPGHPRYQPTQYKDYYNKIRPDAKPTRAIAKPPSPPRPSRVKVGRMGEIQNKTTKLANEAQNARAKAFNRMGKPAPGEKYVRGRVIDTSRTPGISRAQDNATKARLEERSYQRAKDELWKRNKEGGTRSGPPDRRTYPSRRSKFGRKPAGDMNVERPVGRKHSSRRSGYTRDRRTPSGRSVLENSAKATGTAAKNAIRSNGLIARGRAALNSGVERGLGAAGRFAANTLPGRGVVRIANAVGKTAAGKVAGKVAGALLSKTAVPLMVAGAAVDVAQTAHAGYGAYKANKDAKKNEKYMADNYGSIEAATATRHRKAREKKEAADRRKRQSETQLREGKLMK